MLAEYVYLVVTDLPFAGLFEGTRVFLGSRLGSGGCCRGNGHSALSTVGAMNAKSLSISYRHLALAESRLVFFVGVVRIVGAGGFLALRFAVVENLSVLDSCFRLRDS